MKKLSLSLTLIASAFNYSLSYSGTMGVVSTLPNWSGFYAGANVGYTTPQNHSMNVGVYNIQATTVPDTGAPAIVAASIDSGSMKASINNDGFIGGIQLGYLQHVFNNLLAGAEADIQGISGANEKQSLFQSADLVGFPNRVISTNLNITKQNKYLATVRGRLGYLINPSFLFSGTAGLAYGGIKSQTRIAQYHDPMIPTLGENWETTGNFSKTQLGWTVGGNLEWMYQKNWSAKVEYLFYDLGKVSYNNGALINRSTGGINPPAGSIFFANGASTSTKIDGHIIRLGVNYHFA